MTITANGLVTKSVSDGAMDKLTAPLPSPSVSEPPLRGAGRNYQNIIGKDVSVLLLDHLRPMVVFRSVNIHSCDEALMLTV
jgi:hypothetical protein